MSSRCVSELGIQSEANSLESPEHDHTYPSIKSRSQAKIRIVISLAILVWSIRDVPIVDVRNSFLRPTRSHRRPAMIAMKKLKMFRIPFCHGKSVLAREDLKKRK
jgi:hypothetical protein